MALVAVLWAYEGWHDVSFAAGEIHNPQRNFPRGLVAGTLVIVALYLTANLAYLHVLSPSEIASSERVALTAIRKVAGEWGGKFLTAAIVCSILGAMNALILAGPRAYYQMAKDGLFFERMGDVHARFRTPVPALVLQAIWSCLLVLFIGGFSQLFTYVIFGGWIFYALAVASVVALRRKAPGMERPFRVPGYPWVPILFVADGGGARRQHARREPARVLDRPRVHRARHPALLPDARGPAAARRSESGLKPLRTAGAALALALALGAAGSLLPGSPPPASADSDRTSELTRRLGAFIEREMRDKELPALSIALVDGGRTVWAKGFGFADPEAKVAAAADTVYRVGSVSKLFTDIAIMQRVERGELDLDVPIQTILPDFRPKNPFGSFLTLRELMSHRSGLVREPPVGHYFDATEPSLAATVASLNETELVYPPGTHTKYSNAGIAVAGYVLERRSGKPFVEAVKQAVLDPIGMSSSAFAPIPALAGRVSKATMWGYDGRRFPAPTFQLGMAPAGSLYSTVEDLSRFLAMLFAGDEAPGGRVLSKETLQRMWTPPSGEKSGYGIGFRIRDLEGHRVVGHNGAIYGFATSLAAMPDEKLGAVAVTTMDSANAVTDRIVGEALRLMLAARSGRELPPIEETDAVSPEAARSLEGAWGAEGRPVLDVTDAGGELSMLERSGGVAKRLRRRGDALVTDGRLAYGTAFAASPGALRTGDRSLAPVATGKPSAPPFRWNELIGEYGWDYDVLYVLEKDGHISVLIEWFEYDPLTPVSDDVFRFPDRNLYDGETLTFVRDSGGRVTGARVGAVLFPRRRVGPEEGQTFRITPVRPVEELRSEALAASPPAQPPDLRAPDLVELAPLDPTIRLDVRYATSNNFLGVPLYSQPRAFLQRPAAEALARAHRKLAAAGYGLLIHDAYRPWYVTKMFWDATPVDKHIFVADPATGSRHNRGCAVDLTLYDRKTGAPAVMTGGYDEMSDRSFAHYPGGTSLQRWQRDLLRRAMEEEGFAVYEWEWWHFDYKDWNRYPVGNDRFEAIRP